MTRLNQAVSGLVLILAMCVTAPSHAVDSPTVEELQASVRAVEQSKGADSPELAVALFKLAWALHQQGKLKDAEPFYERSLAINEKALGPEHPDVATALNNFGVNLLGLGKNAEALTSLRSATAICRKRIVASGADERGSQESRSNRAGFETHLSLLNRNPGRESPAAITDESFQVLQLEQASNTGAAVAKMAACFASSTDALATLAKRLEDTAGQFRKEEAMLVSAASLPPEKRNEAAIRTATSVPTSSNCDLPTF